jgi:catechol 2,3-dioxygenase-like lactoylglutathione lyase family enzyme
MLDHATVRTPDLEGTRAFLEAVLGRKLGEQQLKEKPPEAGSDMRFAIGRRALWP